MWSLLLGQAAAGLTDPIVLVRSCYQLSRSDEEPPDAKLMGTGLRAATISLPLRSILFAPMDTISLEHHIHMLYNHSYTDMNPGDTVSSDAFRVSGCEKHFPDASASSTRPIIISHWAERVESQPQRNGELQADTRPVDAFAILELDVLKDRLRIEFAELKLARVFPLSLHNVRLGTSDLILNRSIDGRECKCCRAARRAALSCLYCFRVRDLNGLFRPIAPALLQFWQPKPGMYSSAPFPTLVSLCFKRFLITCARVSLCQMLFHSSHAQMCHFL